MIKDFFVWVIDPGVTDTIPWYTNYLIGVLGIVANVLMFVPLLLWIREGNIEETADEYHARVTKLMQDESWWGI